MPMEANPRAVFERLFGDGDSTEPSVRLARIREDRSILDSVTSEIASMQPGLGPRDRSKLNDYLEAVRDIERRIQIAEEQNATLRLPVMGRPIGIPDSFEEQDRRDCESLYKVLREDVVPRFFDRDAQGIPRRWVAMIRRAMVTLAPRFNTWRMVQEYARKYYFAD